MTSNTGTLHRKHPKREARTCGHSRMSVQDKLRGGTGLGWGGPEGRLGDSVCWCTHITSILFLWLITVCKLESGNWKVGTVPSRQDSTEEIRQPHFRWPVNYLLSAPQWLQLSKVSCVLALILKGCTVDIKELFISISAISPLKHSCWRLGVAMWLALANKMWVEVIPVTTGQWVLRPLLYSLSHGDGDSASIWEWE